jgi:hypothetical protein
LNQTRYCGDFALGLRRLDIGHVGAGGQGCVGTGGRLVKAGDGGANLCLVILARDNLLAFEMAGFLRGFLVLNVNRSDATALEFAHPAKYVEVVTIAGVGIRDHRYTDRGDQTPDIVTSPKSG